MFSTAKEKWAFAKAFGFWAEKRLISIRNNEGLLYPEGTHFLIVFVPVNIILHNTSRFDFF